MEGILHHGAYSLEDYDQELSALQDAFTGAIQSTEPFAVAGLRSLQKAFPKAEFSLQDGVLNRKHTFSRKDIESKEIDQDKMLLEDVLRMLLVQMTTEAVTAGIPIMQYRGAKGKSPAPAMQRFLGLIKWISQASVTADGGGKGVLDLACYCRFLEDLLELGTISDCQDVFACMEADLEFLSGESDAKASLAAGQVPKLQGGMQGAMLAILRACNGLLRKLSKANDVQLCGRILVFIARLYRLTDKSGLNLHGSINSGLPLPLDDVKPEDLDVVGQPVDGILYSTFWGLQNAFKNPAQMLQNSGWSKFKEDISTVLDAFQALPITVPSSGATAAAAAAASALGASRGAGSMDMDTDSAREVGTSGGSGDGGSTSVKYLTSSKLFGLQVRDATFRRQFLVQCAALLHFVSHPASKAGTVSTVRHEGLEEIRERVFHALSRTEHEGRLFSEAVKSVMECETHWVAWKKEGCPPFERAPDSASVPPEGAGAASGAAPRMAKRRRAQGPPKPTFAQLISEPLDQMVGLTAAERNTLPSLKEMLAPVIEDMDPEACIDPEYRRKVDRIFTWKRMRMLARTNLVTFAMCKDDLEEAVMKTYPEIRKKIEDHKAAEALRLKQEREEQEREVKEREEKERAGREEGGRGAEEKGKDAEKEAMEGVKAEKEEADA